MWVHFIGKEGGRDLNPISAHPSVLVSRQDTFMIQTDDTW